MQFGQRPVAAAQRPVGQAIWWLVGQRCIEREKALIQRMQRRSTLPQSKQAGVG